VFVPYVSSTGPDGLPMRVLVVDDDETVRDLVRWSLEAAGFDVTDAGDGAAARARAREGTIDAAVLDLQLPDTTGLDLLDELRAVWPTVYVVIASGQGTAEDRVTGLRRGADDYLVKPYSVAELVARLESFDRRRRASGEVIDHGEIRVHIARRLVTVAGTPLELTRREFDLLAFLAAHPREVFSRGALLEAVWGSPAAAQSEATVTEHVRRLRAKLDAAAGASSWIVTERGTGYCFEPDVLDLREQTRSETDETRARRPGR
jgi:DNA-binding response OmpR family regulator